MIYFFVLLSCVLTFFFHWTSNDGVWLHSFVQAIIVSISFCFLALPSSRSGAKLAPELTDELCSIFCLTMWSSAFWAGWLIYSGQIDATGKPKSRIAEITHFIFELETNVPDDIKFVAIATAFIVMVTSSSWVLRRVLRIERKRLACVRHLGFGLTLEYGEVTGVTEKFPNFRLYIDPGRLATTLLMKCFCAASGTLAGFGILIKICFPKAVSVSLGEIFMTIMTFFLPMILSAVVHEIGNEYLDFLRSNPENFLRKFKKRKL